jgi:hypothetical protein
VEKAESSLESSWLKGQTTQISLISHFLEKISLQCVARWQMEFSSLVEILGRTCGWAECCVRKDSGAVFGLCDRVKGATKVYRDTCHKFVIPGA